MNAWSFNQIAMHFGQLLGYAWRGVVRQQNRIGRWMSGKGVSPDVASIVMWAATMMVLAVLVVAAFWVALAFVFAFGAIKAIQNLSLESERPKWEPNDPNDHRNNLFYDPINFNDDSDPRFDDD